MSKLKQTLSQINLSGISTGTVVRTVMLLISIVAFVFKSFGVNIPIVNENDLTNTIIVLFGLVAFLQAYWKNNSITKAAQEMDIELKERKKNGNQTTISNK